MRVEDDEENGGKRKNKSKQKEVEDDLGLSMLIDSQNNQYVLTKPRDSTMPRADHHFIKVSLFLQLRWDPVLYIRSSVLICFDSLIMIRIGQFLIFDTVKPYMYVQDLVSVVMLSLPCGWICSLVGLPPMFGYIICGVLLGPSGLNSIKVCLCV